jgi:hypothetical protein
MREVLILAGADADLLAACCWFEAIDPALADRFDAEVDGVIDRASRSPTA